MGTWESLFCNIIGMLLHIKEGKLTEADIEAVVIAVNRIYNKPN